MKYNLTEDKNWRRKLEITIPEEDVNQKFVEVYKTLKQEARIPGFRPGKAPINIIKARYGKLAEKEVLETMVPEAYTQAIKESGVTPISEPDFAMEPVEEGKPITFSVEFDIKPEFELSKYTGFVLKRPPEIVSDIEVEKAYQHLIDRYSTLKPREGSAEEGDIAIVDMEKLSNPGSIAAENELKGYQFELDKDATLPEFYQALLGANINDIREVDITYPQDYYQRDLAGKNLKFKLTVKEIKEIIKPELNEAFFKQFGEYHDEAGFREKLRQDLQERLKLQNEDEIGEQAIKSVISANEFDLPQSLLENYLDGVVEDFKKQHKEQKIDEKELRERYRTVGIRFLRWTLLYQRIAKAEKITVTKEDTDNWVQNIADKSKANLDEVREYLASQRKIQDIKETILENKVLDFIIKSSTIEDL